MRYFSRFDASRKISPYGPDFARRNFNCPSHLDDFKHVAGVDKIYAERMPAFEKGPSSEANSNIPIFNRMHKLLRTGGVLAFDYMPYFTLFDSKGRVHANVPKFTLKSISQNEIDEFVKSEEYRHFFTDLNNVVTPCADHVTGCPKTPCALLVAKVATSPLCKESRRRHF